VLDAGQLSARPVTIQGFRGRRKASRNAGYGRLAGIRGTCEAPFVSLVDMPLGNFDFHMLRTGLAPAGNANVRAA